MLGVFAFEFGLGDRDFRSAQVGFGIAGGGDPGGDLTPGAFGQLDPLDDIGQAPLVCGDFDEARRRTTGDLDARDFSVMLLLGDLGIAESLTGDALTAQLDHPAHAQGGLGCMHAAQRARAADIFQIGPECVRRGQAFALRAGLHGL